MNNLPNFPSFDVDTDKSNAGSKWEKWIGRLENLFTGLKIDDNDQKRALLLHYAGEKVYDIYDVEKKETATTYDATKKVLNDYFSPKKNVQMEIYTFRTSKQKQGQSLDEFVTELRTLAKNCEFADIDREILQQVIQNCSSNQLRRRTLRDPTKSLTDVLTMGRMFEQSEMQASAMEGQGNVQYVQAPTRGRNGRGRGKKAVRGGNKPIAAGNNSAASSRDRECRNCGYEFPHRDKPCPAKGKSCNLCKKMNHFARCCRGQGKQKQIKEITRDVQSDSENEEYSYNITVQNVGTDNTRKHKRTPKTYLIINGKRVQVTIDTGSSVNVIDDTSYNGLGKPKLRTKRLPKLLPYGGGPDLKVQGSCDLTIDRHGKLTVVTFYLVKGNYGMLVGCETSCELGLVQINQSISADINDMEVRYPGIYTGIGKLRNNVVKLHINETVKPVVINNRRTPFHLREKVEKELTKLISEDIIEKVENEPTPWISPIVTPPKKDPNEIRLCVDMREPNKAIERERHLMPTIDELINDLNGATVFSKLDLSSGYHQLELHPESRYITTFNTHMGIFRYKRLNFGISSASEIFQKTIRDVISGIPNTKNISDDIIVYGKTRSEHDDSVDKVFKALHENGLTLNKRKCEFNKPEITFFGVVFKGSGISADPLKVDAIKSIDEPKNVSELRSFLGMTSYCSRFIKNYGSITEPLRWLTKKDTPWQWHKRQQHAFDKLKIELSSDTVITYFDPAKDIEVITDASPVGLSGILTQEGKVVAYASRALSPTESRYSQTEREALGVVWACEHYAMYLRGAPTFTVVTDHKPLTTIWKKKQPPLRIERWGLRLQPFKMQITYRPGKDNPSDYMSRHPMKTSDNESRNLAEEYVSFISNEAVPNAMTLDEIKIASSSDKTIQKAIELTKSGKWFELKTLSDPDIDMEELMSFRCVKDELIVHSETLLLRNDKLVMPKSLRAKAIRLGHEGHQGVVKTKSYIRSKVWFPNINAEVEAAIQSCLACQANTKEPRPREPLKMSELPSGPWENLSADFCGPLENGDYLFVIIDEYSRYPIVEIIRSVSANTVIPVLDKIIAMFGVPRTVKSDNGSPFNSKAFIDYAKHCGFTHRKITPKWPRANAQAESFNKHLMKSVKAAVVEGGNYKQELFRFLRQYRATPHTSTGFTPFRLMFGREPGTRIPSVFVNVGNKHTDELARQNDDTSKSQSKRYEDRKRNARERYINIGDKVLVKNETPTKSSSKYKPIPYKVIDKKGTMISVENEAGHRVTRNSSEMKTITPEIRGKQLPDAQNEDDVDEFTADEESTNPTPRVNTRPVRERRPPEYLKDYVRK